MQSRRPQSTYRNPIYSRPPIRPQPVSPRSGKFKHMARTGIVVVVSVIIVAVLLFGFFAFHHKDKKAGSTTAGNTQNGTKTNDSFNKAQYSLTDPKSMWVIVNKPHGLSPLDYVPSDLTVPSVPLRVPGNESMQVRKVTATALEKMFGDAKAAGLNLMLASGYRSYTYQVGLYNGYVQSQGQSSADQSSARPGHSEHQTGLAADIEPAAKTCELEACFGTTPEGKWLTANAYKYGFIIRYTSDKVDVTGYEFEPWHVRYVGVDLATEMHKTHVETLEEFFGVSGGPNYVK
jgi:D-alanyl-D-alanine carboxypeptidase